MSLPAVSKHLKVLEAAGLITRGREAQFWPATLNAEPLAVASAWIDDYRRFWTDGFDALAEYLTTFHDTDAENTTPENTDIKENPQ